MPMIMMKMIMMKMKMMRMKMMRLMPMPMRMRTKRKIRMMTTKMIMMMIPMMNLVKMVTMMMIMLITTIMRMTIPSKGEVSIDFRQMFDRFSYVYLAQSRVDLAGFGMESGLCESLLRQVWISGLLGWILI